MKVIGQVLLVLSVWTVLGGVTSVVMGKWLGKVSRYYSEASDQLPGE